MGLGECVVDTDTVAESDKDPVPDEDRDVVTLLDVDGSGD